MNPLLKPAELLYRAINRARRTLYRRGVLKARRLPRPVVSVGNIAAGGAGKTPAVIAIGRFLIDRGHRVVVLTRGYGRKGQGGPVMVLDPEKYGDEPTLIKKHLDKAHVIVGSNRYENGLRYSDADIFILDDGFQHLQLHRDLDIVIDAPAGFFREGRAALKQADLVIPRRLRLDVPQNLRGKRLFAFAGLADNKQFFASLLDEGLTVTGTRGFRDHHRYSPADLAGIDRAAAESGAEGIVTTEKDAVKIARRDIIPIPAEFVIDADVLERIEQVIRR